MRKRRFESSLTFSGKETSEGEFCSPISCSTSPSLSRLLFFALEPFAMAPSVPPPVSPFRPDLLHGKVRETWGQRERETLDAFFRLALNLMLSLPRSLPFSVYL